MTRNKPIPSEQHSQIYNRKFCRVIKYPASFEPTPSYQVPRATLHDKPQTKAARIAFYQFQNGPLDCWWSFPVCISFVWLWAYAQNFCHVIFHRKTAHGEQGKICGLIRRTEAG